jgi:cytochrome o ubiquinol oxidase subunit 1
MPANTSTGLLIGAFSLVLGFAGVWYIWWLALVGLLGIVVMVIVRSADDKIDYYIPADTVRRIEDPHSSASVAEEVY